MSKAEIIQTPNTLKKAKVGTGPAKLDPKLIERAEQAVQRMEKDYAVWVQDDLAALEAAFRSACGDAGRQPAEIRTMFRLALNIKGQGSSFGYQLITAIGDTLAGFLETRSALTGLDREVVAAHIAAMRAVFSGEVRGDGGETGRALVAGLQDLVGKAAAQGRAATAG